MRRLYFHLAEKLGMTVAELLARISSAELAEWCAYFQLEAEDWKEQKTRGELRAEASAGVEHRKRRMMKG